MIPRIPGRCDRQSASAKDFPVVFDSSDRFTSSDGRRGTVTSTHYGQMIQGLLHERSLVLYAECISEDTQARNLKSSSLYLQTPCWISITLYGPLDLYDSIGSWLRDYEVYLQDPRTCHMDVKYCNPYRLFSEHWQNNPMLSEVTAGMAGPVHLQDVADQPDLLDILSGQTELDETPQPQLVKSQLRKHQKQALTFMLRRERGWYFEENGMDMWGVIHTVGGQYFVNRVSNTTQIAEPPHFSGGIIADTMGLGKTLTMLALIATDFETADPLPVGYMDDTSRRSVQATLVVVPQHLLATWEAELSTHLAQDRVKVRRHHGKSRLMDVCGIDAAHVVLTTYQTLSADHRAHNASGGHIMFSVQWRRVILDEAHIIRNMKSHLARAVCALDAASRWAVSGTPIQNHLGDLSTLLKFIRSHPYDDTKRFDADISRLWKSGEDEEAVKRLKRLASYLILRRGKRTIDLPARRDTLCPVDFSTAERKLYDDIRQQALTKMEDALQQGSDLSCSGIYVNFLQQIESMRLVCNLGVHYHERHSQSTTHESEAWARVAQETFNMRRDMDVLSCTQCGSVLDLESSVGDESSLLHPHFSRCLKYTRAECSQKTRLAGQRMICGHTPRCPVAQISLNAGSIEETIGSLARPTTMAPEELPSKVKMLIRDLDALASDVKSIVFSTWRLTLDIVETGLTQAAIRCVRFDGKVPQSQRQSVLDQFKSDPNIRVMLLTLSCGAVG